MNDLKLLREERNKEEEDKQVEGLMNANILTEEQYKEKIMRKEQYLTEEDIAEINKYKFMKIYNLKQEDLSEIPKGPTKKVLYRELRRYYLSNINNALND